MTVDKMAVDEMSVDEMTSANSLVCLEGVAINLRFTSMIATYSNNIE